MDYAARLPNLITRAGIALFAVSLPISHVPAQFGMGIALLGWLADGFLFRRWRLTWHPFLGVLAFYIGWNILAAALSRRPSHSLTAVIDNEWPMLIMLIMFWTIDDIAFIKKIVVAFLITSGLAIAYALWQTFGGVELYRGMALDWLGGYYRAVGFYGFYLTFAAFAMSVFFLSMAFAMEGTQRRWLYAALALASFLSIIGSFARSVWLALAAGIPLFGFLKERKLGWGLVLFAALIITIALLVEPTIRMRAESILDVTQNETRLNLWKTSLNIFAANPILGVGEDNFDAVFEQYKVEGYYDTTVHPHNDYLTVLVSAGLPGLLAFVTMWGIALWTGLRGWRSASAADLRAILLGSTFTLFGLLIAAVFQNYYGSFINCLGWWFVVGLLMTSHLLALRSKS
jgi:O-antigen ligase